MMLMRTTMTLDKDVMMKLKRLVHDSGKPTKEVINDLLRGALARKSKSREKGKPFKPIVYSGHGGLLPGFSWNMSTAQMLDRLDEEDLRGQEN